MKIPEPISIHVDLTNPGQFFACCGLLELASRISGDMAVLGQFSRATFRLRMPISLPDLLTQFAAAQCEPLDVEDDLISPLHLDVPFNLRLDWWRDENSGGKSLKTWGGGQKGPQIFLAMRSAIKTLDVSDPFNESAAVYAGGKEKKTVSPFYFDSRRAGTSLDIGFSPDDQKMSVMAYPAVEALALVGFQRFRPTPIESVQALRFQYVAWAEELPVTIAGLAAANLIQVQSVGHFQFTKPSRGGDYMRMFTPATLERSNNV